VTENRTIFCCECNGDVRARLTNGAEVYPHRPELHGQPRWKCDGCGNSVGCHHKTAQPTRPLGVIPSKEIKVARIHIHRILDPIWQGGKVPRGRVYGKLSKLLGYDYHTGEIRTLEEARRIYGLVKHLKKEFAA
jgi:hypothetical protein